MKSCGDLFFILTGGPGAGKSTTLNELKARGFICISESGREVISEQMKIDGDALPWKSDEKFRDLMFACDLSKYEKAPKDQIVFFDRGFLDILAFSSLIHLDIPADMQQLVSQLKYNQKVFILPPWEEIYTTDSERKQTLEESIATYHAIVSTYQEHGYFLVEVPKIDVISRVDFILKEINLLNK